MPREKDRQMCRCYLHPGSLYYDQGRDEYVRKRKNMKGKWIFMKTGRGPEPVNPLPDYSKSLAMHERLAAEYPNLPN